MPRLPTYRDMATRAVFELVDRSGSSTLAIERWIKANFAPARYNRRYLKNGITRAVEEGELAVHHRHSRSYKLTRKGRKRALALWGATSD